MVACVIANEQMSNMITSSPVKNLLSRVYYNKTLLRPDMLKERELFNGDHCWISKELQKMLPLLESDVFLLAERKIANLLLSIPIIVDQIPKRIWLNERSIFEYPLVVYYHREKPRIGWE